MNNTRYLVGVTDMFGGTSFITVADSQEALGRLVILLGQRYILSSVTIMPNFIDYDSLVNEIQSSQDDDINFGGFNG